MKSWHGKARQMCATYHLNIVRMWRRHAWGQNWSSCFSVARNPLGISQALCSPRPRLHASTASLECPPQDAQCTDARCPRKTVRDTLAFCNRFCKRSCSTGGTSDSGREHGSLATNSSFQVPAFVSNGGQRGRQTGESGLVRQCWSGEVHAVTACPAI
jgi:hypothetical protein